MKVREAGVPARFLQINSKVLYAPYSNHSLNFIVVDSTIATVDYTKKECATITQIAICYSLAESDVSHIAIPIG